MISGLILLVIIFSAVPISSVEKPTAAFIETHMEEQLSIYDYWHAAVSFDKIGFRAHLLSPYTGVQKLHPDNLTDLVSVLLITPRDGGSLSNDIDMLLDYVSEGNGMIIAGQGSSSKYQPWARERVNEITSEFGIIFERNTICDPNNPFISDSRYAHWPMIDAFSGDEVTDGLDRISYHAGCSLQTSGNASPVAWTSEESWADTDGDLELDDDEDTGKKTIAAISTYGKGRIACIGDNDLWSSRFLNSFDNNQFLLNMVRWVSGDIVQAELQALALDTSPKVHPSPNGNYTAAIPIGIWNQGTGSVSNINLYKQSGGAQLLSGNITVDSLGPGELRELEAVAEISPEGSESIVLAAEYWVANESKRQVLRSVNLEFDVDLFHLGNLLGNVTEITYGGNTTGIVSASELEIWGNETSDIISDQGIEVRVLNHSQVASKTGGRYTLDSQHTYRDVIGMGGPDANFVSGYISQEGRLEISESSGRLRFRAMSPGREASLEEIKTGIPKLGGNASSWGYLCLYTEHGKGQRLAVGGLGRRGIETSVKVLWKILQGDAEEYREELSSDVAIFRATFNEQGQIVDIEFA